MFGTNNIGDSLDDDISVKLVIASTCRPDSVLFQGFVSISIGTQMDKLIVVL